VIGWLLDTNVISELARPNAEPKVVAWADTQDEDRFFLSVLTLGEYDKGIEKLPPETPARIRLMTSVAALEARFSGRILGVSDRAVRQWGSISGRIERVSGRAAPVIDTLLAATALEHDLYLVTRNVVDVATSGAAIFNPWIDDPKEFVVR